MSKKKKTINLSDQNITFLDNGETFKLLSLNLNSMDVEVLVIHSDEARKSVKKMPLGHLPKEIKKRIRPL